MPIFWFILLSTVLLWGSEAIVPIFAMVYSTVSSHNCLITCPNNVYRLKNEKSYMIICQLRK